MVQYLLRENPGTNKVDYPQYVVPAVVEPDIAEDGRSPVDLEADEDKDEHVDGSGDCNTALIHSMAFSMLQNPM